MRVHGRQFKIGAMFPPPHQEPEMYTSTTAFVQTYLRVLAATLFLVACTAFATIPYSLASTPGEPAHLAAQTAPRHLT